MTDEEIIDIMYDHATTFSGCVQFSDQGVLDFARAIRNYIPEVVQTKTSGYNDELWAFLESADRFIGAS
jgi:hypothetical protein